LPLAIELAAARVKSLTPQAILTKLENRLSLLTGGARDLPARQKTMRASIEWSDELLTGEERLLFRHLAVFAGGFTIEAAEAVCGSPQRLASSLFKLESAEGFTLCIDILDCVTSLVNKSLLVASEQSDGNSRFQMLGIVREYALEFLEKNNEVSLVHKNHANYFLALAEEAEPHLSIAPSVQWLCRLEEEHDNLRAALRWSLENNAEMAARLTAALRYFWSRHNHLIEARKWFELALDRGGVNTPTAVRFKLLNGNGMFAKQQGDYEKARMMYEMGLSEGRSANDGPQIASSSRGLGMVAIKQGDFETAGMCLDEALAISRMLNDKFMVALTLSMLGDLARLEGDSTTARSHFEASLVISRQLDDKWFLTGNLNNLGFVSFDQGDYDSAQLHFSEALAMVREFRNNIITSYTIDGFCALATERGEMERAAQLAGAAENLRESAGSEIEPAERCFRDTYLAKLNAGMSRAVFSSAYDKGRKLRQEEAVLLCLE
jgi:tetratricopeptide (TPR) repeat protein